VKCHGRAEDASQAVMVQAAALGLNASQIATAMTMAVPAGGGSGGSRRPIPGARKDVVWMS
jgi:hypothetical protein